MHGETVKITG